MVKKLSSVFRHISRRLHVFIINAPISSIVEIGAYRRSDFVGIGGDRGIVWGKLLNQIERGKRVVLSLLARGPQQGDAPARGKALDAGVNGMWCLKFWPSPTLRGP